jgi:hypothetical protein
MEPFRHIGRLFDIRPLWIYLYLFKATLALLLVIPFYVSLDPALSRAPLAGPIVTAWDMSVIIELFAYRVDAIPALVMVILIGAMIFVIIMQFFNGGLYYVIVSGKYPGINWRDFFAEAGANFGAHIKITLLMGLVYLVLLPASLFFVNMIGMAGRHLIGTAALLLMFFKLMVIMLILLAASIFSDSARSAATAFPGKSLREILKIAAEYYRPRLFRLLKIFIITYIPFLLIWMAVEWSAWRVIGMSLGIIGIGAEFLLFQISSVIRTGQKLWYLIMLGRDFRTSNPGRFIPEQVELKLED